MEPVRAQWRQEAAFAHVTLRAAVPDGGWDLPGRESAVVQVWLDGAYHQDVLLVRGPEEAAYERLLGALPAGTHEVMVRPRPDAPPRPRPELREVSAGPLQPRDAAEALAWRHAPWICTRAEDDPWESLWTDTPLVLFYRFAPPVLEYQCLFSNEDGGTDTRGLLAQWGRTTDIEWVLRLDLSTGRATVQGRDHVTEEHPGAAADGRMRLQVVGVHGMVSGAPPHGRMRCLFLPRYRWDDALPREAAMDAEPWTWRVAALEMAREGKLTPDAPPGSRVPGDLRDYVYVQALRADTARGTGVEVVARLRDGSGYRSTHGDTSECVRRPYAFSTAVRLPRGTQPVALEAVAHPPWAGRLRLQVHKAFRLDERFLPLPPFATGGAPVTLGADAPRGVLWRHTEGA